MQTKIFDLLKTDHEMYKQWSFGITDVQMHPIVSRIEPPKDNRKKVVIVFPSFLSKYKIKETVSETLVLILDQRKLVTMYYCKHPDYLFKKEKDAEFQTIY